MAAAPLMILARARLLSGLINSIVEWYRPGSPQAGQVALADVVCQIAFDGLRVRRRP
jgi:hypothetical protein